MLHRNSSMTIRKQTEEINYIREIIRYIVSKYCCKSWTLEDWGSNSFGRCVSDLHHLYKGCGHLPILIILGFRNQLPVHIKDCLFRVSSLWCLGKPGGVVFNKYRSPLLHFQWMWMTKKKETRKKLNNKIKQNRNLLNGQLIQIKNL